jgi:N-acetylmuramoyl-L-alanine amidase
MPPEHGSNAATADPDQEGTLTLALLDLAGQESVRVVEALAAALVNALRDRSEELLDHWSQPVSATHGLCEDGRTVDDFARRLGLCRRIARRAVRGSLADPTNGANAFHRIEASPPWARELLPIAMHGSYLFYRR